jgi:hypothetical protein
MEVGWGPFLKCELRRAAMPASGLRSRRWGCCQLWRFLTTTVTPTGPDGADSGGRERVNRTVSEFGMDLHGRPWTALARTGNVVSGVTRIEGSSPSRSAPRR